MVSRTAILKTPVPFIAGIKEEHTSKYVEILVTEIRRDYLYDEAPYICYTILKDPPFKPFMGGSYLDGFPRIDYIVTHDDAEFTSKLLMFNL